MSGAIRGLAVIVMVTTVASFIWLCRQWSQWFAQNVFVRIVLPLVTLAGLLAWGGAEAYREGGWNALGNGALGLVIFVTMAVVLYRRCTAHTRFKP
jgi:hypothetical protein